MSNSSAWIGVDFDGTLARYDGWTSGELGAPVPRMVERVKEWLEEGIEVRIVTARVANTCETNENGIADDSIFVGQQRQAIQEWCLKYIGKALIVQAYKDFNMLELWDDRAVQVRFNTGERVDGRP